MGSYHRKVSTSSSLAQQYFDQAMTAYYAFNNDQAISSFQQAARLDPENWSETKNVNHSVVHSGAAVMLKPSDLQALSANQTAHLQDILITIQSSRREDTKAITHNPGEILDVDFEEITDADLAEAIPY